MPAKKHIRISNRKVLRLHRSGTHSIRGIAKRLDVNTPEGKSKIRKILEDAGYIMRRFLSAQECRIIRKYYPHVETKVVVSKLKRLGYNRTIPTCYRVAMKLGLRKTKKYRRWYAKHYGGKLAKAGLRSRFREGHTTWNHGLQGKDWQKYLKTLSPANRSNIRRGQFKKGNYSKRWHGFYNGMVHLRADRGGRIYKMIRLSPGKWEYYHRYLWEKHRGKIPRGKLVVFKNFNIRDCRLSNLMLITRKEHGRRWSQTAGSIANQLARKKGGRGIIDRRLYHKILNNPALVMAKRAQNQLHQEVVRHG